MSAAPTVVRILYRLFHDLPTGLWVAGLEPSMAEWTGTYELRKMTAKYTRTPATGVVQDAAMTTHHFLNITGGDPDASWITADYTAVESAFDTFWGAIKALYGAETKLSEYSWRADGPAFKPFGASLSPTLRLTARSVVGTGSNASFLPPQVAVSVTEVTAAHYTAYGVGVPGKTPGTGRTQLRNRWGRFYLPNVNVGNVTSGRLSTAAQTTIADAAEAMYQTCVSAGLVPVVYSPTNGNAYSVDAIHVDDIFDVIRSRRFIVPLSRAERTIE